MSITPINISPVQYYNPVQSYPQPLPNIQNPGDMYVRASLPQPVSINWGPPQIIPIIIMPVPFIVNSKAENTAGGSVFKIEQSALPHTDFKRQIDSIPDINKLDKSENWIFDVRGTDLSGFDLSDKKELLRYADFDSNTKWPTKDKMPKDFNPQEVLEKNKDPGLGIRKMHERGYTGKGVTVAIIDQPCNINHTEYKDQIINYEEIGYHEKFQSQMHSPAVASILAGKTVGVAPDCKIALFAANNWDKKAEYKNYIKALKRIMEMNKSLPDDQKICAVSLSNDFDKNKPDYSELQSTIKKAEDSGIFFVSCALDKTDILNYYGLYRDPQLNQDDPNSYNSELFEKMHPDKLNENVLLIPMDHRTTASFTGNNDYAHYANGGLSWCAPYIAGMYAVAKQIKPSITPKEFWKVALETGTPLKSESGKTTGKIINPLKLTESLEKS